MFGDDDESRGEAFFIGMRFIMERPRQTQMFSCCFHGLSVHNENVDGGVSFFERERVRKFLFSRVAEMS